jgi:signal transduction histidine kinase
MGVSSPAGPERPGMRRRSIRYTFAVMVLVPEVFLVLLWAAAVSLAFNRVLAHRQFSLHNHRQVLELVAVVGGGLVVGLAAVILMGSFARRLSRDISILTAAAERLEDDEPAQAPDRSRGRMPVTQSADAAAQPQPRTAEIAHATAAVASLQQAATASAASESSLRDGLRQVVVSMARRNQSLLQRQLRLIDALEQKASDPAALADLFSLDHLTTRMRRHAESLTILSGTAPARSWREPIPVIDIIRGAMAEVEDYQRVNVLTRSEDAVAGSAAADMIHLLAELLENAAMFSPSGTPVEVRAGRVANGLAIEIDDRGLGIEPEQLSEINEQLATPPDFDLANSDRLGLFVGAKLAARYGVRVALRPSPYGGTTAIVLMPASIVVPATTEADTASPPDTRPAAMRLRSARLDLRGGGSLALVGQQLAPASPAAAAPASPAARARPGAASSAAASPAPAAPARPAAETYRGLPRRTRLANLPPQLQDPPATAASAPDTELLAAPLEARAPEQARDLAASLQGGWRRGRQEEVPPAAAPATTDTAPTTDTASAKAHRSAVPKSEEH